MVYLCHFPIQPFAEGNALVNQSYWFYPTLTNDRPTSVLPDQAGGKVYNPLPCMLGISPHIGKMWRIAIVGPWTVKWGYDGTVNQWTDLLQMTPQSTYRIGEDFFMQSDTSRTGGGTFGK